MGKEFVIKGICHILSVCVVLYAMFGVSYDYFDNTVFQQIVLWEMKLFWIVVAVLIELWILNLKIKE